MTTGLAMQPDATRLTLGRLLADVVARHAAGPEDRAALRFEGRDWSHRELDERSLSLSRALAAVGVGKGTRVALWMANRPEWAVALFAAARVGAVVVPVNTYATAEERDHVLRHSDAALLLMQRRLLDRDLVEELRASHPELREDSSGTLRCPALPYLRRVAVLGLEAGEGGFEAWPGLLARGDDVPAELVDAMEAEVHPADDALLVYTSGTTALPKGILHTQRAPVVQSWRFAELMGLTPEDRVYTAQPFFWTAGTAMSLGASLAAGATLILEETFDAARALALLESERVTALHAWPHQEKALAEQAAGAGRDLSRLRKIEATSPLAPLAGIEKDTWGIHASYGMSETFTLASALPASAPSEARRACHGRALPGMRIRIVDPESGEPLPPGASGEIAVKGITFMRGYAKQEPGSYLDADGYFRTGDGGHLDADGTLHWTGRITNLIKTGGANVSPEEIETALRAHPDLALSHAVGVPHPTLGEAVVLCAVAAEGAHPTEDELRAFLRERLASYKVPKRVLFFRAGELSFTGSQKLRIAPLREAALGRLGAEGAQIEGFRYES